MLTASEVPTDRPSAPTKLDDVTSGRLYLHVVAGNLYGGVERMLATIARHAPVATAANHEYAICFPGRLHDELRAADAVVHELGATRLSRPWTWLRARRRLHETIAVRQIDAVLFHSCWPLALLGWSARQSDCRSVLWSHDAIHGRHWVERLARRRHVDQLIANSRWVCAAAAAAFPGVPAETLCCPAELPDEPTPRSGRIRSEIGCPTDRIVIVQVGRLEPWKGHRRLIEAVRQLRDGFPALPAWEVWVVGGPQRPQEFEYQRRLQQQVAEWKLTDRVRWLGQRSDVTAVLADADLFCQPNETPEPLGIVFLEAMAQGLPIVTTNFGGAQEIIPSSAGLLTPPDDVAALVQALSSLIADPMMRRGLQAGGPQHARTLADPVARLQDLNQLMARSLTGSRE
jgi:glycosyltransferase involved in cell wall biosynthesis